MVPGLLARRPHGLHRRSLWRACAHRRARRSLLFWGDHRPLLDAGRDGLLDRAMRPFPVLQGIEARLLRLIERKVELCVAVEAVERQPRAGVPIASRNSSRASIARRACPARAARAWRSLATAPLMSFRFPAWALRCPWSRRRRPWCRPRGVWQSVRAKRELMRKSPLLQVRRSLPARRRPRGWSCRSLARPIGGLPALLSLSPPRAGSGALRAAPAAT